MAGVGLNDAEREGGRDAVGTYDKFAPFDINGQSVPDLATSVPTQHCSPVSNQACVCTNVECGTYNWGGEGPCLVCMYV